MDLFGIFSNVDVHTPKLQEYKRVDVDTITNGRYDDIPNGEFSSSIGVFPEHRRSFEIEAIEFVNSCAKTGIPFSSEVLEKMGITVGFLSDCRFCFLIDMNFNSNVGYFWDEYFLNTEEEEDTIFSKDCLSETTLAELRVYNISMLQMAKKKFQSKTFTKSMKNVHCRSENSKKKKYVSDVWGKSCLLRENDMIVFLSPKAMFQGLISMMADGERIFHFNNTCKIPHSLIISASKLHSGVRSYLENVRSKIGLNDIMDDDCEEYGYQRVNEDDRKFAEEKQNHLYPQPCDTKAKLFQMIKNHRDAESFMEFLFDFFSNGRIPAFFLLYIDIDLEEFDLFIAMELCIECIFSRNDFNEYYGSYPPLCVDSRKEKKGDISLSAIKFARFLKFSKIFIGIDKFSIIHHIQRIMDDFILSLNGKSLLVGPTTAATTTVVSSSSREKRNKIKKNTAATTIRKNKEQYSSKTTTSIRRDAYEIDHDFLSSLSCVVIEFVEYAIEKERLENANSHISLKRLYERIISYKDHSFYRICRISTDKVSIGDIHKTLQKMSTIDTSLLNWESHCCFYAKDAFIISLEVLLCFQNTGLAIYNILGGESPDISSHVEQETTCTQKVSNNCLRMKRVSANRPYPVFPVFLSSLWTEKNRFIEKLYPISVKCCVMYLGSLLGCHGSDVLKNVLDSSNEYFKIYDLLPKMVESMGYELTKEISRHFNSEYHQTSSSVVDSFLALILIKKKHIITYSALVTLSSVLESYKDGCFKKLFEFIFILKKKEESKKNFLKAEVDLSPELIFINNGIYKHEYEGYCPWIDIYLLLLELMKEGIDKNQEIHLRNRAIAKELFLSISTTYSPKRTYCVSPQSFQIHSILSGEYTSLRELYACPLGPERPMHYIDKETIISSLPLARLFSILESDCALNKNDNNHTIVISCHSSIEISSMEESFFVGIDEDGFCISAENSLFINKKLTKNGDERERILGDMKTIYTERILSCSTGYANINRMHCTSQIQTMKAILRKNEQLYLDMYEKYSFLVQKWFMDYWSIYISNTKPVFKNWKTLKEKHENLYERNRVLQIQCAGLKRKRGNLMSGNSKRKRVNPMSGDFISYVFDQCTNIQENKKSSA